MSPAPERIAKPRPAPLALASLATLAALGLVSGLPAPAHHTNVMQYVFQRVGEAKAGPFDVVLTAGRPRLTAAGGKELTPAEEHKRLEGFTHRFQAEILSASPVPPLRVRLRFTQEEWSRTFALERAAGKGAVYSANVTLGPRGRYEVEALLEGGSPAQSWRASFAFDHDYEKLKDVMQALLRSLERLGKEALTLGLDGEIVPPAKQAQVQGLAVRFRELVPWAGRLREGASQERYEAEVRKPLDRAKEAEAAAARADYAALAARLADVRAACESCHRLFQQADAAGRDPKLPPAGLPRR